MNAFSHTSDRWDCTNNEKTDSVSVNVPVGRFKKLLGAVSDTVWQSDKRLIWNTQTIKTREETHSHNLTMHYFI